MSVQNKYNENIKKLKRKGKPLPKANVVRISILNNDERRKYLGIVDAFIDEQKQAIYDKIYEKNKNNVFYGILQGNGDIGFSLHSNWQKNMSSGTIGGFLRTMSNNTSIHRFFSSVGDIIHAVSGINKTSTGSSTMRSFESAYLDSFSVDCAWYIPEQYEACILSLKNIFRMAYPFQIPPGDLKKTLDAIVNYTGTNNINMDENSILLSSMAGNNVNGEPSFLVDSINTAVDYFEKFNDFLGYNFSLDPIPVRCSIGHYIDVEPLVIESLDLKFSKETFLHEKTGRHLPITCYLTINLGFWMTPAPKIPFMNLVGEEMFGLAIPESHLNEEKESFDRLKSKQLENERKKE